MKKILDLKEISNNLDILEDKIKERIIKMKKILDLIEELHELLYDKYCSEEDYFTVEGNLYFHVLKFNDIIIKGTEETSLEEIYNNLDILEDKIKLCRSVITDLHRKCGEEEFEKRYGIPETEV